MIHNGKEWISYRRNDRRFFSKNYLKLIIKKVMKKINENNRLSKKCFFYGKTWLLRKFVAHTD